MSENDDSEEATNFSPEEAKDVQEMSRLRPAVVYEIIRSEGKKEIDRPALSLWWSGLAAGLAISFSLIARALLHAHLPDTGWRLLVESFGYCVGFLIVIVGRLQLFTENTLTAVLPLIKHCTADNLRGTARLWGIVFLANMTGTFLSALIIKFGGMATDPHLAAIYDLSQHLLTQTAGKTLLLGIPAGFLIASVVWMLPSAEGSEVFVITVLTYLIAVGGYSHVIAGSTEAFLLVLSQQMTFLGAWTGFIFPALCGNVIGGTVLFAFLAYGQVREEID